MNIQHVLKQLLLIVFLYSSSTSCAPLIALLCGGVGAAAQGVAAGAVLGSVSTQKEMEGRIAQMQADALNAHKALACENAHLLEMNTKLTAQCKTMKEETVQLAECRAQLAKRFSLELEEEHKNRLAAEEDCTMMHKKLELERVRNFALQRNANLHRTVSRSTLGIAFIGACIGYWSYQRPRSSINRTDHQNETPDILHHHQQTVDQSHQMRSHCDG
jgi:hypothetical protein